MKKIYIIFLLFIFLFISFGKGKKFKKEPSSRNQTLTIGYVKMVAEGYDGPDKNNNNLNLTGFDGTYNTTLKLFLYNIKEKGGYTVYAKNLKDSEFGYFYQLNMVPGEYIITYIGADKKITAGNYVYTYNIGGKPLLKFTVEEGKVNNMGEVILYTKQLEADSKLHGTIEVQTEESNEYNMGFDTVKKWFSDFFSKSEWNNKDWISTDFIQLEN
ncbi:MAG: hypothetical protein MJB14_18685 [Spirochaetes bacterium]|nr:hypothetical protein [Spirochaetota bacterium]